MSLEKAQEISARLMGDQYEITRNSDAIIPLLEFIDKLIDRVEVLESEMDELK